MLKRVPHMYAQSSPLCGLTQKTSKWYHRQKKVCKRPGMQFEGRTYENILL